MFCVSCGNLVQESDAFCHRCGAPTANRVQTRAKKSNKLRALLWLVGVLVALTCLPLLFTIGQGGQESRNAKAIKQSDPHTQKAAKDAMTARYGLAVLMGKKIRSEALDPSGIRFNFAGVMADGSYCYDFSGNNASGGKSRIELVATKDKKVYMNSLSVASTPEFAANWNKHCANKTPVYDVSDVLNDQ